MFGKIKTTIILALLATVAGCAVQKDKNKRLTDYANPFIGTTTLWDSIDLGYNPTRRAWGAETFPGSSLPNSMVQPCGEAARAISMKIPLSMLLFIPAKGIGISVMFH